MPFLFEGDQRQWIQRKQNAGDEWQARLNMENGLAHTHTICEMIPNTFPNFIPNSSPVEFFDGANARNIFNEIQTKAATETDKMNANVNSYGQIVKMPKIEKWEKKRERKKDKIFATMNSLIRSSMVFWEK